MPFRLSNRFHPRRRPPFLLAALAAACGLGELHAQPGPAEAPAPAPTGATALPVPAEASDGLPKIPEIQQARAALRDKLPEVAVVKLRRALESGRIKPAQRGPVTLLLAESLIRAGRPAETLALMDSAASGLLPETRAEAAFWRAQALARLDLWTEAETLFAALGQGRNFRYAAEAAFSRAGMLAALGELDKASRVLQPLLEPGGTPSALRARLWMAELRLESGHPDEAAALIKPLTTTGSPKPASPDSVSPNPPAKPAVDVTPVPEVRYLQARIALAAGDTEGAEKMFASLAADDSSTPVRLQQAARLGLAKTFRTEAKIPEALSALRQIAAASPAASAGILDTVFQEIEALNHPPTAEMEAFLTSLANNPEPAVKLRARLALAAALESVADPAQAEAAWAAIPKDFPDHPLRALALLRQAQFLASQDRRAEAVPLLEQLRKLSPTPQVAAWSAWVAGRSEYDSATYRKASANFLEAASRSPDPATRAAAAYNAALSELQSGVSNPARSLALLDGSSLEEYKMAGAEFHLERALRLASMGDPDAVAGLKAFAESLPGHPRRFDALVALAEIALRADPPRPQEAAEHLAAARSAASRPWHAERAALLDCYVSEASGGADAFAAKAAKFLTDFPASAARTDVRMKMAQLYYQRENFSGARQLFEAIAEDDPLNPLAEPALFWAGRAALLTLEPTSSQQAMTLWEKVYERGGPLRWQARLQEARLNQRQRQPAAALQLADEILAATPPVEASTRWQALSIRGDLLAATGRSAVEQTQGLEAYDMVLQSPGLPAAWHRQTLVRKGVALEALARTDEALEAYYDVLSTPPAPWSAPASPPEQTVSPGSLPEDYWFHRAGDKAMRLLEKAGKAEEAIEIAKKLAKAPGPRGRAAAELVDELALKYGIWTGSP